MKNHISQEMERKIWDYLRMNRKKIGEIMEVDDIYDKLAVISDIYMPALVHHQKVFPKYKGIYKGKSVVITGTGPTFDYYHPMEDCIHMGVNQAFFRKDIKYDYLFVTDGDDGAWFFDEIFALDYELIKFFGIHSERPPIPEFYGDREDVERFYVEAYDFGRYGAKLMRGKKFILPIDISLSPLRFYGTSLHCAFQFALWTHPDKIYIVGADSSGRTHAKGLNYDKSYNVVPDFDFKAVINPWRRIKEFTDSFYPDIEIISLNPVGLKGIFRDEYTKEYRETGTPERKKV